MSNQDFATDTERIVVHLVHGTGATDAPWTRAGSSFREGLRRGLSELGVRAAIEFVAPQWDGKNRHSSRLAGAERVRHEVRAVASQKGAPTHQVLIGHSHGGSACVLACADGEWGIGGEVDGLVCLSTPFLVFRRAPYLRRLYLACWVTWLMVGVYAGIVFFDSAFVKALLPATVLLAFGGFLYWALRNGYDRPEAITAPESLPVPTLLIRCPGDEASGALGASLLFERIIVLVTGKVASFWAWLDRHRLAYVLFAVLASVLGTAIMFLSMWMTGSLAVLKWPAIVLAVVFSLVLVVPLLLSFPLRSLLYLFSYGRDVATRGVFLDVSAESTPPGVWLVHTIFPQRADSALPGLAHSEPYANKEAIDIVVRWVSKLVEQAVAPVQRENYS